MSDTTQIFHSSFFYVLASAGVCLGDMCMHTMQLSLFNKGIRPCDEVIWIARYTVV